MEEQNQQVSAPVQTVALPAALPGVKELLKQSWQIYKSRFSTFIAISALSLVSIPFYFFKPAAFLVLFPIFILLGLVVILVSLWQPIAMLYAVKDREQKVGFKQSFKMSWPKIGPYFWTEFLAGLAVLGGIILLIIPGLIFTIWFTFSGILVITENIKGKVALSRSKQLVKGNFWAIVGRTLAMAIIVAIITFGLGFILNLIFGKLADNVGTVLVSTLVAPFTVTYLFLIYEELKKIKG